MALTTIQTPQIIQLSNNYIPLVYSSNSATTTGFKYKVDLYTSTGAIFNSVFLWPDITNSYKMIYNLSFLYKDYMNYSNNWNTETINYCDYGTYAYKWNVTEYIGLTSGATTNNTTYYTLLRGVKQYDETFTYSTYLPRTTLPTAKFLSKQPAARKYKLTDWGTVNTFWGTWSGLTANWNRMNIVVRNISTSAAYYINQSGEIPEGLYTLPIGPKNLNAAVAYGGVYNTGGSEVHTDIITSDTNTYEISLSYSSVSGCSETIYITMDRECNKHTPYQLVWLGDLSTMETFTFTNAIIKNWDIKRNTWKKNLHELNTNQMTYTVGDRGYTTKDITATENYKLISGWLTDQESINLMEMLTSPEVFLIKNDTLYPIIIETNKVTEMKIENNKTFNYEIDFSMAYDKNINI